MHTDKEYIIGREINSLRSESTGEYSLPDYNGDVKKVLSVRTHVFPTGKFVGDDLLEFSGTVGYEVVYVDAENNLTHLEFSTDYEGAVRINSSTYVDSDVKTSVVNCNARLIGPRKFSVKCALDSDVCISERRTYSVGGDAFIEYEPETLTCSASVFTSEFSEGEVSEINEELSSLDGVIADEVQVLLCDVTPSVASVEMSDGDATVKGSLNVSVLVSCNGEMPRKYDKLIPYNQTVPSGDMNGKDGVSARIEIRSIKPAVVPSEDGVVLTAQITSVPKIFAKGNSQIELITDAYVKERGSDNEYSDFSYTEYITTEKCEEHFSGEWRSDDLNNEKTDAIIHSDATARVDSCEICDSMVKITGEIRFSAIACQVSEDGVSIYAPIKFALPFEQNVNTDCQMHDNMRVNAAVSVHDVRMDIADGTVVVGCNLICSAYVFSDRRQRCLGALYLTDEEYSREESVLTVYYPDSTESLFDIAKRFHTSCRSIAECNRLTEATFASTSALGSLGVKRLLIK